jgi:hypothetical protein
MGRLLPGSSLLNSKNYAFEDTLKPIASNASGDIKHEWSI